MALSAKIIVLCLVMAGARGIHAGHASLRRRDAMSCRWVAAGRALMCEIAKRNKQNTNGTLPVSARGSPSPDKLAVPHHTWCLFG